MSSQQISVLSPDRTQKKDKRLVSGNRNNEGTAAAPLTTSQQTQIVNNSSALVGSRQSFNLSNSGQASRQRLTNQPIGFNSKNQNNYASSATGKGSKGTGAGVLGGSAEKQRKRGVNRYDTFEGQQESGLLVGGFGNNKNSHQTKKVVQKQFGKVGGNSLKNNGSAGIPATSSNSQKTTNFDNVVIMSASSPKPLFNNERYNLNGSSAPIDDNMDGSRVIGVGSNIVGSSSAQQASRQQNNLNSSKNGSAILVTAKQQSLKYSSSKERKNRMVQPSTLQNNKQKKQNIQANLAAQLAGMRQTKAGGVNAKKALESLTNSEILKYCVGGGNSSGVGNHQRHQLLNQSLNQVVHPSQQDHRDGNSLNNRSQNAHHNQRDGLSPSLRYSSRTGPTTRGASSVLRLTGATGVGGGGNNAIDHYNLPSPSSNQAFQDSIKLLNLQNLEGNANQISSGKVVSRGVIVSNNTIAAPSGDLANKNGQIYSNQTANSGTLGYLTGSTTSGVKQNFSKTKGSSVQAIRNNGSQVKSAKRGSQRFVANRSSIETINGLNSASNTRKQANLNSQAQTTLAGSSHHYSQQRAKSSAKVKNQRGETPVQTTSVLANSALAISKETRQHFQMGGTDFGGRGIQQSVGDFTGERNGQNLSQSRGSRFSSRMLNNFVESKDPFGEGKRLVVPKSGGNARNTHQDLMQINNFSHQHQMILSNNSSMHQQNSQQFNKKGRGSTTTNEQAAQEHQHNVAAARKQSKSQIAMQNLKNTTNQYTNGQQLQQPGINSKKSAIENSNYGYSSSNVMRKQNQSQLVGGKSQTSNFSSSSHNKNYHSSQGQSNRKGALSQCANRSRASGIKQNRTSQLKVTAQARSALDERPFEDVRIGNGGINAKTVSLLHQSQPQQQVIQNHPFLAKNHNQGGSTATAAQPRTANVNNPVLNISQGFNSENVSKDVTLESQVLSAHEFASSANPNTHHNKRLMMSDVDLQTNQRQKGAPHSNSALLRRTEYAVINDQNQQLFGGRAGLRGTGPLNHPLDEIILSERARVANQSVVIGGGSSSTNYPTKNQQKMILEQNSSIANTSAILSTSFDFYSKQAAAVKKQKPKKSGKAKNSENLIEKSSKVIPSLKLGQNMQQIANQQQELLAESLAKEIDAHFNPLFMQSLGSWRAGMSNEKFSESCHSISKQLSQQTKSPKKVDTDSLLNFLNCRFDQFIETQNRNSAECLNLIKLAYQTILSHALQQCAYETSKNLNVKKAQAKSNSQSKQIGKMVTKHTKGVNKNQVTSARSSSKSSRVLPPKKTQKTEKAKNDNQMNLQNQQVKFEQNNQGNSNGVKDKEELKKKLEKANQEKKLLMQLVAQKQQNEPSQNNASSPVLPNSQTSKANSSMQKSGILKYNNQQRNGQGQHILSAQNLECKLEIDAVQKSQNSQEQKQMILSESVSVSQKSQSKMAKDQLKIQDKQEVLVKNNEDQPEEDLKKKQQQEALKRMLEAENRDNDRQRDQQKNDEGENLDKVRQLFGKTPIQHQTHPQQTNKQNINKSQDHHSQNENERYSNSSPRSYQHSCSSQNNDAIDDADDNILQGGGSSQLSSSIASSYFESQLRKQKELEMVNAQQNGKVANKKLVGVIGGAGVSLGLDLKALKDEEGNKIQDFQDDFMAKYDEFSESWRQACKEMRQL